MILTPEEIEAVAKFCWWPSSLGFDAEDPADVAHAEAILIERGLGEAYGRALRLALLIEDAAADRRGQYLTDGEIASIRTAPLEVCVRAMAQAIEEAK